MATSTRDLWLTTLEAVALRNGAVELTCASPTGEDRLAPTYRSRVLAFSDQGLTLQLPSQASATRHLRPGTSVCVLVVERSNRWGLHTRIEQQGQFHLNRHTAVPALQLAYPHKIHSAQRRHFFRASTAGLPLGPAVLRPNLPQGFTPPSAPEREVPQRLEVTLVNIGGGGLGVETPASMGWLVPLVSEYDCKLSLPEIPEPISVRGKVVRAEELEDQTFYLGMMFLFKDHIERRYCTDQICRFTTWVQRQHLRNQRQRR